MSRKYKHIMSPLKVGNVILKSRLLSANALPHFLQEPELYPSDAVVDYLVGLAKNGAAIVTIGDWTNLKQREGFGDGDLAHPTGFNSKPHDPLTLQYAAAIKASGATIIQDVL